MFALTLFICTLPFIQDNAVLAKMTVAEVISRAESYYKKRDNPENLWLAIESLMEAEDRLAEKTDRKLEAKEISGGVHKDWRYRPVNSAPTQNT